MMRSLNRMLIADLIRLWRQGIAIVGLLACGIATFIMSTGTMKALEVSRDQYYQQYRFAHLFVSMVRAPNSLLDRIAEIPGVQAVSGGIVREVLLDVPNMMEPVSCRLVSIEDDPRHAINGLYLRRGRFPVVSERTEVMVSELFAEAHRLNPGDRLTANMGGRMEQLHIVGIGISPEYIYVVQPGLLLSDDRRYGVIWAPYKSLAPAFNMEGGFNRASVVLSHLAKAPAVMNEVDRLTKPFGGMGAYLRDQQESHERVADEMHQVRAMALLSPSIFLLVTLFLLHIVFSRLVHQQRESIATLRAFGYFPREIGWHYMRFVLVWVALGISIGVVVGVRVSWWMGTLYMLFFRFPTIEFPTLTWEWGVAVGMAVGVAVIGSFSAIRNAMRLPPAVAMRPESPSRYGTWFGSHWGRGFLSRPLTLMIIRRLESNPWITLFSTLGLALGLAVVVLSSFMEDTIDYVLDNQFVRSQRQDMTLSFYENCSESALSDVLRIDGVIAAEPFRAVPIRIRYGTSSERLALMGLEQSPELFRVLDVHEQSLEFPEGSGLTITRKLAELLRVKPGESVEVEFLEGQTRVMEIPVARVFPNFTGPAAYMRRSELHQLLREGERISGVFVKVDPTQMERTYSQIKQTPAISGVLDKRAAMHNFKSIVSQSTFWIRTVNSLFAAFIAFGVSYNSALIAYTERARDLATMRVMGFSRKELATILLSEIGILTAIAIPIGIPISYAFCYLTTLAIDTDSHRFPLVVDQGTVVYGIIVLVASITLSSVAVVQLLNRIDMLSVLKGSE